MLLSPGDLEIRATLLARLRATHATDEDVAIFEELGLCRGEVRVDVTLVNGALHGYEIKSDRDSLRRLDRQVALYSAVLDRATLVVGERYESDAANAVPGWWGIELARTTAAGLELVEVRPAASNPRRNPRALIELLWLDDALALLARRGAVRGFRGRPRRVIWDRACEVCDVDEIAAEVRACLKSRAAQRVARSRA